VLHKHISTSWMGGFHILSGGGGSAMPSLKVAGFAPRCRERGQVRIAVLCLCLLFIVATPAWPQGSVGSFATFEVSGGGTGVMQGAVCFGINAVGVVTGMYEDPNSDFHGFVRTTDGAITPFDAPDAYPSANGGTYPFSINAGGIITGMYNTENGSQHGFVRAADGTIAEFDVPGAGTTTNRGTNPISINSAGEITGTYTDKNSVWHGFLRTADGKIATFDAPGAGTGLKLGTQPISINSAGVITGNYEDASYVRHGFIRAANGTFTAPIDAPGAGTSGGGTKASNAVGTMPFSINTAGDITGVYFDGEGGAHGFVRTAEGVISTFDAPGVGTTGKLRGTLPVSINTAGDITGFYMDASEVLHGFVRSADGTITPFDAPGAGTAGTSLLPGSGGISINDLGVITGAYADASGAFHGYVAQFTVAPQGQVSNLQNTVEDLVSAGTLSPGHGQFLLAPLNGALAALGPASDSAALAASDPGRADVALPKLHDSAGAAAEQIVTNRGHAEAAIRDLQEFIGRVQLLMLSRQLNHADGGTLIDAAKSIIGTLRSKP